MTIDYSQYLPLKTVTVKEVFEAIEKNGFEHLRREWLTRDKNGKIIAGCVLGQAAVNLKTLPAGELFELYMVDRGKDGLLVDDESYEELRKLAIKHSLSHQLNQISTNEWTLGLGSSIISINDAGEYVGDGLMRRFKYIYTWEEIVNLTKNMLIPYFDQEVTLLDWDLN